MKALFNIVKGLNKAGFSAKDYKLADPANLEEPKKADLLHQLSAFPTTQNTTQSETQNDITSDIDTSRIVVPTDTEVPTETVSEIEKAAAEQVEIFDRTVAEMEASNTPALSNEIQQLVKTYSIKDSFQEQAEKINLPQFYLKVPASHSTLVMMRSTATNL